MSFEVRGKVAIITGAAAGIGFLYAKDLLQSGLKIVVVVDVNKKAGEEAVKALCDEFGLDKAIFVKTDVSDDNELEEVFKVTFYRFKSIDIVINNAAIVDEPNWNKVIDTNLKGIIRGTLLGLDYISKYKSGEDGLIINMSSVVGLGISPGMPFYSTTKTGVVTISRSLGAVEHYTRTKVKIITICPGLTNTPLIAEGLTKIYSPEFEKILRQQIKGKRYSMQEPSHVSKSLLEIIRKANTGSVWVVENGEEPFELEFPERWGVRKQ